MYTDNAEKATPNKELVAPTSGRAALLQRGKDKPRLTTDQKRAARRVKELSRIYYDKYPNGLPHNGLGVKYARYMCRTMAFLPDDRRAQWLERHAAWMAPKTRDYILSLGAYWYSDRSLGDHLELHDEDRERCRAWSIEAIDVNEEQRRMINKEKNRRAQEKRRRKNGAKPQAQSERRTKPWAAMGMSKSTYYRRKKRETISSRPSLILSTNDESVSSSKPLAEATTSATLSQPLAPSISTASRASHSRSCQEGTWTPSEPHASRISSEWGFKPGGIRERAYNAVMRKSNVIPFPGSKRLAA